MLNRLALRLITVRALRGRTLAGAQVLDSESGPIDDVATDTPTPVLIVYTDDGHFRGGARDLFAMTGDNRADVGYQHLVIEFALTQRMRVMDGDGETEAAVQPRTDAAIELYLDLLERQIVAALMDPRPDAEWADLWRSFTKSTGDRESQRGSSARDGTRFAGRQIRLSVQLPKDPPPGEPLGPLWTRFLAKAGADADLAQIVPLLTAALTMDGLTDWQQAQQMCGLSSSEARAMLYAAPAADAVAPEPLP